MKSKITPSCKELDEETLRAMIRPAVNEGSPGDDNMRFAFQVAAGETSDTAGKRRVFEGPNKDKSEQGAAGGSRRIGASRSSKSCASEWWESHGGQTKTCRSGKTHPTADGRKNCQKYLAGGKEI